MQAHSTLSTRECAICHGITDWQIVHHKKNRVHPSNFLFMLQMNFRAPRSFPSNGVIHQLHAPLLEETSNDANKTNQTACRIRLAVCGKLGIAKGSLTANHVRMTNAFATSLR